MISVGNIAYSEETENSKNISNFLPANFFTHSFMKECIYKPVNCICCEWSDLIAENLSSSKEFKAGYEVFFAHMLSSIESGSIVSYVIVPTTTSVNYLRSFSCLNEKIQGKRPCYSNSDFKFRVGKFKNNSFEELLAIETNGIVFNPAHNSRIQITDKGVLTAYQCVEKAENRSVIVFSKNNKIEHTTHDEQCSRFSYEQKKNYFIETYKTGRNLQ